MTFNEIKQITKIPPAIKINWFKQGEFCGYTIGSVEYMAMRSELTIRELITEYSSKLDETMYSLYIEDDKIHDFVIIYDKYGRVNEWFPKYKLNNIEFSVLSETLEFTIKLRTFQLKNKIEE